MCAEGLSNGKPVGECPDCGAPVDSYGINFIKVRGVSSSGDVSEDMLFSDEHILNNVCIGYWYLC